MKIIRSVNYLHAHLSASDRSLFWIMFSGRFYLWVNFRSPLEAEGMYIIRANDSFACLSG